MKHSDKAHIGCAQSIIHNEQLLAARDIITSTYRAISEYQEVFHKLHNLAADTEQKVNI